MGVKRLFQKVILMQSAPTAWKRDSPELCFACSFVIRPSRQSDRKCSCSLSRSLSPSPSPSLNRLSGFPRSWQERAAGRLLVRVEGNERNWMIASHFVFVKIKGPFQKDSPIILPPGNLLTVVFLSCFVPSFDFSFLQRSFLSGFCFPTFKVEDWLVSSLRWTWMTP